MKRFWFLPLVALILAACAVGPDPEPAEPQPAEKLDVPEMVFDIPVDRIVTPNCPAPAGYYSWGPVYDYNEVQVREGGWNIIIGQSIEAKPDGGGINHKVDGDNSIRDGEFLLNLGQDQILPLHLCNGTIWVPGEYITECAHPEGWTNVREAYTLTNNEGIDLVRLDGANWKMEFVGDPINGTMDILPGVFMDVHDLPGVNETGTVRFYMDCFGIWWIEPYTPLPALPTPTPPNIAPSDLG